MGTGKETTRQVRLTPSRRQRLILEHARDVVADKGAMNLTVREVASAAGVSMGTVTHHFSGIAAILAGVLDIESRAFRKKVVDSLEGRESSLDGLLRLAGVVLADDDATRSLWSLWLAAGAQAAGDEDLARFLTDRYETWREVIRELVDEGLAAGELTGVDAESATLELVALIDGYGMLGFFDRSLEPRDARTRALAAIRDRFAQHAETERPERPNGPRPRGSRGQRAG